MDTVSSAYESYFTRRILKNLPSPYPADPNWKGFPTEHFAIILEKDRTDPAWARAAREKEEKWSMYLSSLKKAGEALDVARMRLDGQDPNANAVKELVEGTADILGPYLGDTVRFQLGWN